MILYDCLIALGFLTFLPRVLWESRKKQFPTLRQRFGIDVPDPKGRKVIWIHAVSVGEVKSAAPLVKKIREHFPDAFLLITTASVTGQEEAKRSLKQADAFHFLPLDFSWIMKRWARILKPQLLLFIESDIWYHLIKSVSELGGKIALVSGKISERSANRYKKVPFLAKKLFSYFDLLLLQNEEHRARFATFLDRKLHVTGNLKFDTTPIAVDKNLYADRFKDISFAIALTCTHAPEEEELLDALQLIEATLFLAPRHPERFQEVADLLARKNIDFVRWSQFNRPARVILVDGMGLLPLFYAFSQLAIVAGSFSSHVGGHNLLEPCFYSVPVFFGPHTHQQSELAQRLLHSGAGVQLDAPALATAIRQFIANPAPQQKAVQALLAEVHGPLEKSWSHLRELFL